MFLDPLDPSSLQSPQSPQVPLPPAYCPNPARADPADLGLARDGQRLDLWSFSGDGWAGGVVSFLVTDVDALYVEFLARQVPSALPPTDQAWGRREM